jgi:hypothetical protein
MKKINEVKRGFRANGGINLRKAGTAKIISLKILLAMILVTSIFASVFKTFAGSNVTYYISNSNVASNARILLEPAMTSRYTDASGRANPYKQRSYNLPSMSNPNYGCAVTAYITGRNIIYGETLNPHNYVDNDQNAICTFSGMKALRSADTSVMANELANGKPVVVRIKTTSGYHWVLVVGINETSGRTYYYYSDFICIDPVTGQYCNLTSAWGWNSNSVNMKLY